jgi:hypothetical protein
MSKHFKQRQSRRIDLLIEQEKAEARLKCEKLITSRHGKEAFETFLREEQPAFAYETGQTLLDTIPEEVLERLVSCVSYNAYEEVSA